MSLFRIRLAIKLYYLAYGLYWCSAQVDDAARSVAGTSDASNGGRS